MKVAIPITTETEISAHFGRSPAFLVFALEDGQILGREVRPNDQAGPGPEPAPAHGQAHAHAHDHSRFVQLLRDCQAVVGRGMGAGARQSLEAEGIAVRVLSAPCSPEEAALLFARGRLEVDAGPTCGGSST
ncbi:iron-molybdenum cofactor biosynthesis protein [Geothrix rubra]|uniref:Iron-molybdenum cofactor biosynthesis protein n=1 Tax=Geothrix rubra TaxID=2927977 RepID=A0ABQ5Q5M7_9BACT|nr:NifB/NifX family molybdenum-iron cluster-binding protein [Geothrix rubra]GLH69705.1 iron-molybdenum cofactor biosynthesis protein [Geothrix rubra]